MEKVDIAIIGAGVVGLAIAAEVTDDNRKVLILEKNDTFGLETSSRNSQVIHSGIYYPQNSLKARLCIEGNTLLYGICDKFSIGCKRLGKIIIATDKSEEEKVETLYQNGLNNGVDSLQILTGYQVKRLEPHINAIAGLYSPNTGIIDVHHLMRYFLFAAKEKGASLACRAEVRKIEQIKAGYRVITNEGENKFSFVTTAIINAAGLHSDRVASMAGIDIEKAGYRLYYCKGEYFSVGNGKNRLVNHLVYPPPHPTEAGLGVHITLDLEGRMRLGPSVEYIDRIDYSIDASHREEYYRAAKKYFPPLEIEDIEPEMAGVRPKLQPPGGKVRDFVIAEESEKGLPGLINLIGIESPGMTAAPAIAGYVNKLIGEIL